MKTALVTLAIGDYHHELWHKVSRRSWRAYVERHGYDLIVLDRPLDESPRARSRSPAWQKLLILNPEICGRYDRVVWVDSDILINPLAPGILEGVPVEKIGAVDEMLVPGKDEHRAIVNEFVAHHRRIGAATTPYWEAHLDADRWHQHWGLPGGQKNMVQTGVMVLAPRHHREIFEHVYHGYEDKGEASFNYEMRPLSYEILRANLAHWIDERFNWVLFWQVWRAKLRLGKDPADGQMYAFLMEQYLKNHFLHFAGVHDLIRRLAFLGVG